MIKLSFLLLISFIVSACAQTEKKNNITNYNILWEVETLDTTSNEYKGAIRLNNLGLYEFQLNNFSKAIEYFDSAIIIHSGIPKIYANRGGVYYETREYFKALSDFNKAIELDSLNPYFLFNRGLLYKDMGQYAIAISDFENSISIYNENAYAYSYLGICYARIGYYEKSEKAFNESVKINPKEAELYYNRSVLFSNLGELELQKKDLEKTLELDSLHVSALNNLGYYYMEVEKDYNESLKYYSMSISIEYNPNAYYNRAQAYSYLKKYDKAIADINYLIDIEGEDKQLISTRARFYKLNGEIRKAEKDLEKLKNH